MNPNKTVECMAPFSSIYLNTSKNALPCCVIKKEFETKTSLDQDLQYNFDKSNRPYRKQFKNLGNDFSKYTNCTACYDGGKKFITQRNVHNDAIDTNINYIENPTLTNLHIKFSNLCNLACRMCDPSSSNLLWKESKLTVFEKITDTTILKIDKNMVIDSIPRDTILYKSILENLDKINFLWFSGGETFLQDQVWEILTNLYENNLSKNIVLTINTNGTVKLSDKEISILKSFKFLKLHVSMDGIGELAEYIRTNLNWQIWCKNFKIYVDNFKNLDNCEFSVMTTISIYNIHKFLDINQFFMQNFKMAPSINFVYGPKPESAAFNLSDENKKYIINLYKNSNVFDQISNFLNSNKATMFCDHIVKLIDRRDNAVMNGQLYKNFKPFREVEPEWYDRLKNF